MFLWANACRQWAHGSQLLIAVRRLEHGFQCFLGLEQIKPLSEQRRPGGLFYDPFVGEADGVKPPGRVYGAGRDSEARHPEGAPVGSCDEPFTVAFEAGQRFRLRESHQALFDFRIHLDVS